MSKTPTLSLGGKPLPVDVQTVWTDEDGKALGLGDGLVKFDFTYRQIRFAAQLDQNEGRAHLRLVGDLGPMPFSAESPAARAGLSRIVEAANQHLGGAPFKLAAGRMLLGSGFDVPAPVTAHGLVTALVKFLVPALSYLDLIAIYVRPPLAPSKPGESAVRPEWRRRKFGR